MSERMTHVVKCWPLFFQAVWDSKKTFEIRENDRGYGIGDTLVMNEYDPDTCTYSGRQIVATVTYVLTNEPWVPLGYIAMSIRVVAEIKQKEGDTP